MSYFRRAIISIAEVIALISVVVLTIGGMALGDAVAQLSYAVGHPPPYLTNLFIMTDGKIWTWIGGLVGFSISLMLTATFLVLVEIAKNTRNETRY
jgi:hypothetical protein